MKIVLIGNDYVQQFPLISYGGIESCVESIADIMLKKNIDFKVIVPKRIQQSNNYEYVLETNELPTSISKKSPYAFCEEAKQIIKYIKPDIIWSQSNWSVDILSNLNIPIISSFHDSCDKKEEWISNKKHHRYRFLSRFQYNNWIKKGWEKDISFQCYTGLTDSQYKLYEKKDDYFLWCAGLQWGFEAKGLDIFIALARMNPKFNFIAYGSGNELLAEQLCNIKIPNFKFLGELTRGDLHDNVFGKAKAVIIPTKIPDTFPRTCIEALSKGTPIVGSNFGSIPETIELTDSGYICNSIDEFNEALYNIDKINVSDVFNKSKIFHIENELDTLIKESNKLIESLL
jgi:glycosyltransferase involved in cell wall biosynthesis